jgi:O-antigen ligase
MAVPIRKRHRSWRLLALLAIASWALLTAAVIYGSVLQGALCQTTALACRPSVRPDAWQQSFQLIASHPILGVGSQFRFDGPIFVHPHNGLIGVATFYGLPILAAFLALLVHTAKRIAQLAADDERLFAAVLFILALGYMGSDLSDPIRFVSTHYLFLWLPLFWAAVGGGRSASALA